MLILDRTQRTWALISSVILALATAAFCWTHYSSVDGARGGTFPGLLFGITSAAMMFYAGLLGARRRVPSWQFLGSGSFWMRSHLWIGTLTVPFALFHAGFQFGGPLEVLLWVLFIAVVLSGFWGLAMQNVLPKMMLDNLPRETFIQQIPHLCTEFVAKSDELVKKKCGSLEIGGPAESSEKNAKAARERTDLKPGAGAKSSSVVIASVATSLESKATNSTTPPLSPANNAVSVKAKPDLKAMLAAKAKLTSVARTTSIPGSGPESPAQGPTAPKTDPPAGKPDPKAILAAARAKKELAAAGADSAAKAEPTAKAPATAEEAVHSSGTSSAPQTPVSAKPKPDPKAILAAARAKKELEAANAHATAEVPPAIAPQDPPVDAALANQTSAVAKPKPDPKAILAAARAKKELEAANAHATAEVPSAIAPQDPVDAALANQTSAVAKPKPDPKAILAAARAKKKLEAANAHATAEVPPAIAPHDPPVDVALANQTTAVAKPKPDPKAILAAARAKKELEAANARATAEVPPAIATQDPPVDVALANQAPAVAKPKPDPKAILAAARAKKELEAANAHAAAEAPPAIAPQDPPVDVALVNQTPAVAKPKPDPKALLAAARAKKEQAEQGSQPAPAIGTVAEVKTPNAPKPKPDPKAMLAAGSNKTAANPAANSGDPAPAVVSVAESPGVQTVTSPISGFAAKPKPVGSISAGPAIGDRPQRTVEVASHRRMTLPPNDLQKDELKRVYLELIQPYLGPQKATPAWKESIRKAILACRVRQTGQHPDFIPIFEQLQDYCEQRQQFEFVKSYHFWMHRWLIIHIPATVALYVILIAHGVMALRVIPFGN